MASYGRATKYGISTANRFRPLNREQLPGVPLVDLSSATGVWWDFQAGSDGAGPVLTAVPFSAQLHQMGRRPMDRIPGSPPPPVHVFRRRRAFSAQLDAFGSNGATSSASRLTPYCAGTLCCANPSPASYPMDRMPTGRERRWTGRSTEAARGVCEPGKRKRHLLTRRLGSSDSSPAQHSK